MWPPVFLMGQTEAPQDDSAFPARPHVFGVDDGDDERPWRTFPAASWRAYIASGSSPRHLLSAVIMTLPAHS